MRRLLFVLLSTFIILSCGCNKDRVENNSSSFRNCSINEWYGEYQTICDSGTIKIWIDENSLEEVVIDLEMHSTNGGVEGVGGNLFFEEGIQNFNDSCYAEFYEWTSWGAFRAGVSLLDNGDLIIKKNAETIGESFLTYCDDQIVASRIN
jgi:hypothetical protein